MLRHVKLRNNKKVLGSSWKYLLFLKANIVSPVLSILVNFPSVFGWGFQNVKSIHSLATAAASALQLFLIYDDIVLQIALLQL